MNAAWIVGRVRNSPIWRRAALTGRRRRPQSLKTLVVHLGPDTRDVGGIASVIGILSGTETTTHRHAAMATWRPARRDRGALLAANALLKVLTLRLAGEDLQCHLHLSERGSFLREGAVGRIVKLLGGSYFVTLHGADFLDSANRKVGPLASWVIAGSSGAICLGPLTQHIVRERWPAVPTVVASNPVDLPPLASDAPKEYDVIFAGEIGTRKGFDLLKVAFQSKLVQQLGLRAVVCGPEGDISPLNLPSNMNYVGVRSRQAVLELVEKSRVACLPSRREVLPMFILEAMSMGVAVVATAAGEVGQLTPLDGVVIVPARSESLASELAALTASTTRCQELGVAGRRWVEGNALPPVVLARYESLYGSKRNVLR